MTQYSQIAVIGLYRSGSTATAGILHNLGVEMGAPFWGDYFESEWLSRQLRNWWSEPNLIESVPAAQRVQILRHWLDDKKQVGFPCVGFKHPLLCLCANDLIEAWGESTRLIWTYRPLEESIQSIVRLNWWSNGSEVQQVLWNEAHSFFADQKHLRIDFFEMLDDPAKQIDRIVDYIGLTPTDSQIEAALRSIWPRPDNSLP